jgi:hypothetical protein
MGGVTGEEDNSPFSPSWNKISDKLGIMKAFEYYN